LNNDDDGDGDGSGDNDNDLNLDQQHLANVTETNIQNMIVSEVGNNDIPATTANTLYFVFIQPGALSQFDTVNSFGGHHRSFTNGGNTYYYAVIPLSLATTPTGSVQQSFNSLTSVISHELAEAITDPILNTGWDQNNSASQEIGDLCNGVNANYHGYNVQELSSNAAFPSQNTAANSCIIEVDKPLDSLVVNAPANATENQDPGTFTVATFHDQDSTDRLHAVASDFTATITWGDSATTNGTVVDNGNGNFAIQADHVYGEEGSYTLGVQINDVGGSTISGSTTVSVFDPAVVPTGGFTVTAAEGADSGPQTVATFTDPAGAEALSNYSADINWGDGTGTQVGAGSITVSGGVFTVNGSHTYAEESTADHSGFADGYHITVTLHHDGATDATANSTATVTDPSVAAKAVDVAAKEGILFALPVATFTDPGGPEPVGDYSADIDWGDGTVQKGLHTITYDPGTQTFTVTGSNTFAEEGTFHASVTINHEGATPVTVNPASVVRDNYGLLLLDPTGAQSLQVTGNGAVTVNNTGAVVVDSGSPSAYFLTGNAVVTATEADVGLGGGTFISGRANLNLLEPEFNHEAATPDPIALPLPPIPATHFPALVYSGSAPLTLSPGTYDGGIFIDGSGPVTMLPGVYYMNGGGFFVSGQGSVTGTGVLIVNAPLASTDVITIAGQGSVNLTAPTALPDGLAKYDGITIMQDPASANPISVVSQGSLTMTGTLYAASALLKINGTGTATVSAFTAGHLSQGGIVAVADAMVTVHGQLTINADPAPAFELATGLAGGLTADGDGLLASRSGLRPGRLLVAVEDSRGALTSAEQARIADAIRGLDAALAPFGVDLVEATGAEASAASVRLDIATQTDFGGVAQGVLGVTENGDAITIVSGWNWYMGADPSAIGPGQYDFETVVAHELGHALGLGEGSDPSSVMYPYLASGLARRALSAGELGIIDAKEEGGRTTPAAVGDGVAGPGPRAGVVPAESGARVGPDSAADEAAAAALTATSVGAAAEPGGTAEAAPAIAQPAGASAIGVAPAPAATTGPAVTIWTAPANLDDLLAPADASGAPPAAEPSPADGATPPDTGANGAGAAPAAPAEPAPAPADREAAALLLRSTDACFTASVPVPVAPPALLAAEGRTGSASQLAAAGLALGLSGWRTAPRQEETRRRRPVLK
jgi:hypothetical protein